MTPLNAIYTVRRECQDCHKCIRECPVKAIRVQDGYAAGSRDVRTLRQLHRRLPQQRQAGTQRCAACERVAASGRNVAVSLAPSFVAQFPGLRAGQLIHALKKLGFFAVSETALGAQHVSASVAPSPRCYGRAAHGERPRLDSPLRPAATANPHHKASLAALTLGALGVVFGDIGTSPLYTLRECLHGRGAAPQRPRTSTACSRSSSGRSRWSSR